MKNKCFFFFNEQPLWTILGLYGSSCSEEMKYKNQYPCCTEGNHPEDNDERKNPTVSICPPQASKVSLWLSLKGKVMFKETRKMPPPPASVIGKKGGVINQLTKLTRQDKLSPRKREMGKHKTVWNFKSGKLFQNELRDYPCKQNFQFYLM